MNALGGTYYRNHSIKPPPVRASAPAPPPSAVYARSPLAETEANWPVEAPVRRALPHPETTRYCTQTTQEGAVRVPRRQDSPPYLHVFTVSPTGESTNSVPIYDTRNTTQRMPEPPPPFSAPFPAVPTAGASARSASTTSSLRRGPLQGTGTTPTTPRTCSWRGADQGREAEEQGPGGYGEKVAVRRGC